MRPLTSGSAFQSKSPFSAGPAIVTCISHSVCCMCLSLHSSIISAHPPLSRQCRIFISSIRRCTCVRESDLIIFSPFIYAFGLSYLWWQFVLFACMRAISRRCKFLIWQFGLRRRGHCSGRSAVQVPHRGRDEEPWRRLTAH